MGIITEPTLQVGKQSSKSECLTRLYSYQSVVWAQSPPTPGVGGAHELGLNGARVNLQRLLRTQGCNQGVLSCTVCPQLRQTSPINTCSPERPESLSSAVQSHRGQTWPEKDILGPSSGACKRLPCLGHSLGNLSRFCGGYYSTNIT